MLYIFVPLPCHFFTFTKLQELEFLNHSWDLKLCFHCFQRCPVSEAKEATCNEVLNEV